VNTAKPKPGRRSRLIGDGGGLWLEVTRGEGANVNHFRRSWTFRYQIGGKRHEMGLGPLYTISLPEARAKAKALRQQLLDNIDPLEAKEAAARAKLAEQARTVTFEQCAQQYIRLHAGGWGAGHHHQWRASLATHVYPTIGRLAVSDVDQAVIMRVIEPLWTTRPTTASRVLNRIERILDFAAAHEYRRDDNPAARVVSALPKKSRIAKVKHFASEPWAEMPQLMQELRGLQTTAARCMEFLILTAARSDTAICAQWREIDRKAKVWVIPAEHMKSRTEHRIPLSKQAIELLDSLPHDEPFVFGGNKSLQETALRRQVLAKLRPGANRLVSTATVHGMRAAFKTWAGESTNFANETIEIALAHKVGNQAEQAYERGDKFVKRARLMQAWADFLDKPAAKAVAGNVVPMKAGA